MRVGFGYDVHRLTEGRPLIIGGVEIPYDRGLLGHSDADVLLHAIGDALLGAAALGDIGMHFPDTDDRWKGADSKTLLEEIVHMLEAEGLRVNNVDATVVLERPKLRSYIDQMRAVIAECLRVDVGSVSVKATTNEALGPIGHGEGVAAFAVCTVRRIDGALSSGGE